MNNAEDYFSQHAQRFGLLYEQSLAFRERENIWCHLLEAYSSSANTAIDIGCGTGRFSLFLAKRGIEVTGVDAAEGMIELCQNLKSESSLQNLTFVKSGLPQLEEVPAGTFDLVITSSVLEYVDDLEACLGKIARLLADNGILIVSMPNAFCLNRYYHRLKYALTGAPEIYRYIKRFMRPEGLSRKLRSYDLALVDIRYYDQESRISKMMRRLNFPALLRCELFVSVYRKEKMER